MLFVGRSIVTKQRACPVLHTTGGAESGDLPRSSSLMGARADRPALKRAGLPDFVGRGEKIRTSDPLHPMQVRYQAALRPDVNSAL